MTRRSTSLMAGFRGRGRLTPRASTLSVWERGPMRYRKGGGAAGLWRWCLVWLICAGGAPWAVAEDITDRVSRAELFSAADSLAVVSKKIGEARNGLAWVERLSGDSDAKQSPFGEVIAESLRRQGLLAEWGQDRRAKDLGPLAGRALLCVRPALDATEATHWIFLEKIEDSMAVVSSSRALSVKIAVADLTPLWNGTAVWFAEDADAMDVLADRLRPRRDGVLLVVVAVLSVIVCAGLWVSGRRVWPGGVGGQAGALAVCCVSGAVWLGWGRGHEISGAGPAGGVGRAVVDFRRTDQIAEPVEVDLVDEDELRHWVARGEMVWVDARTAEEFARGRVSGAVLVDRFDSATVRLRLAGLAADTTIVVYCVNEKCGRARAAAAALQRAGFTRVFDYAAGWQDLSRWPDLEIERDQAE